ncbi:MAG: LLM class flavin-dependent oxidoreductase [Chloroflexota bacterium]|nr:LLM class flavin-dependent oxidoreductase [Chloroflexota bacterium]MDE2894401.1 LLM class flavin-dependent oxidoreductase [Chloroflexota bacterium]
MDCGTFLLLQSPSAQDHAEVFARATEMAQVADRLGFDSIWCAEHHFSTYGYLSRPLMFSMHLAAHTERIRVGSAVVVLPLHHPLVVAEEIATADLLSGGRLDVGLGRGYQKYEFERLGHTLDESRERFDESVDILLKAFEGKPFAHEGKHYCFDETSIFPMPVQQPHPPFWMVGQSPESIVATAKRGFNLISGGFGIPIERLAEFRQEFDRAIPDQAQRNSIRVSTQRPVYVTHDESELPEIVEQARWNMRVTLSLRQGLARVDHGRAVAIPFDKEPSVDDLLDRYFVVGTPDTCIAKIRQLREVMGIDHFNANFWFGDLSQQQILNSMNLFAEEVLPLMKSGEI